MAAMPRSRVFGVFIDTATAQSRAAVAFWSAAVGVRASAVAGEEQFTMLPGAAADLVLGVQTVATHRGTTWTSRPTTSMRRWPLAYARTWE